MIFRFCRNNLSVHVYLFLDVLLIFKVGHNNISGHVYVFHVVMTCYTSTCQHKATRPCNHYRNIRGVCGGGGWGVHRRFRTLSYLLILLYCCRKWFICNYMIVSFEHTNGLTFVFSLIWRNPWTGPWPSQASLHSSHRPRRTDRYCFWGNWKGSRDFEMFR